MSKPGVHASKQATKRLQKEYQAMQKGPPPFVWARPNEANILEWHFILRGPPDSPYHGGEYWGTVTFPGDYPFAPPAIKMMTPSGRFAPSTAICTSMSNFHPGSWNPAWSVNTILVGLLSFMLGDEITTGAPLRVPGSIRATENERHVFATASHTWNIAQPKFRAMFPDYSGPVAKDLPVMGDTAPALPPDAPKQNLDVPASLASLLSAAAATDSNCSTDTLDLKGKHKDRNMQAGSGVMVRRLRRSLAWTIVVLFLSWAALRVFGETQ
ncbi:Ubiquitin-conjugating enzyme E2 6 [Microbotryomycetes sp. JL221]|nr:Ubiquitin-conjugating enzyme E2 6 [Microbotryomycetes sp. JL221]